MIDKSHKNLESLFYGSKSEADSANLANQLAIIC